MGVDLFDFDLPDESIALRPVSPRDHARMLVIQPDGSPALQDERVHDLPSFLRPGDALVFNDTRVIPAQLEGRRLREGASELPVSATLHMRAGRSDERRGGKERGSTLSSRWAPKHSKKKKKI